MKLALNADKSGHFVFDNAYVGFEIKLVIKVYTKIF